MKLRVLGTFGPYPKAGGACSGYLIESDAGKRVLIDCGAGVMSRLAEICDIDALDAVILTHLHYDHMSDMLVMRYALDFSKRPGLDVYLPRSPESVFKLLEDCKFNLHTVSDDTAISLASMEFAFLKTVHPVEGYSVRISENNRSLVYTSDTNVHQALAPFAKGCDFLLADAGMTCAQWSEKKPHMSAFLCGMLAKECGAGKLALTHFNPQNDERELLGEAREAYPDALLAYAGKSFEI